MSVTRKQITAPTLLTASAATLGAAVPANAKWTGTQLTFKNGDTIPRTVTVHIVPSGGTASTTNMIVSAKSLAAGETWTSPDVAVHTIPAASFIQVLADVTSVVTVHSSTSEIV